MDKKLASKLLPLVPLEDLVIEYAQSRQDQIMNEMVVAKDMDSLCKLQGAYWELNKLKLIVGTIKMELER